ncbi:hypothetical protein DMUE_3446 [Dictyocoela muelleri]|nr:hypothetical protein DMUE_3446 [Dictyocoela muelleri]
MAVVTVSILLGLSVAFTIGLVIWYYCCLPKCSHHCVSLNIKKPKNKDASFDIERQMRPERNFNRYSLPDLRCNYPQLDHNSSISKKVKFVSPLPPKSPRPPRPSRPPSTFSIQEIEDNADVGPRSSNKNFINPDSSDDINEIGSSNKSNSQKKSASLPHEQKLSTNEQVKSIILTSADNPNISSSNNQVIPTNLSIQPQILNMPELPRSGLQQTYILSQQAALPQQPLSQQPLLQQPLSQQPFLQQPFLQQPLLQQPLLQQPLLQQPLLQQPLLQQPVLPQQMIVPQSYTFSQQQTLPQEIVLPQNPSLPQQIILPQQSLSPQFLQPQPNTTILQNSQPFNSTYQQYCQSYAAQSNSLPYNTRSVIGSFELTPEQQSNIKRKLSLNTPSFSSSDSQFSSFSEECQQSTSKSTKHPSLDLGFSGDSQRKRYKSQKYNPNYCKHFNRYGEKKRRESSRKKLILNQSSFDKAESDDNLPTATEKPSISKNGKIHIVSEDLSAPKNSGESEECSTSKNSGAIDEYEKFEELPSIPEKSSLGNFSEHSRESSDSDELKISDKSEGLIESRDKDQCTHRNSFSENK